MKSGKLSPLCLFFTYNSFILNRWNEMNAMKQNTSIAKKTFTFFLIISRDCNLYTVIMIYPFWNVRGGWSRFGMAFSWVPSQIVFYNLGLSLSQTNRKKRRNIILLMLHTNFTTILQVLLAHVCLGIFCRVVLHRKSRAD